MKVQAPRDGYCHELLRLVVVYAESERSGDGGGWNDGMTRQGQDTGRDDVRYLDTLVARVVDDLQRAWERERRVGGGPARAIDRGRCFAVGLGNGAVMVQRWYQEGETPLRGLAVVQGPSGGARHAFYASRHPFRRVNWAPLGVLFLVNGQDRDWADDRPGLEPDGHFSEVEALTVYGDEGQAQGEPERLSRWNLLPVKSVEAWTSVFGLRPWSGTGDWRTQAPLFGFELRVRHRPKLAHGWLPQDRDEVLRFFSGLA